jgi:hypothetical protein
MAGLTVGGRSVCAPMRPRGRCGRPAGVEAPSWTTWAGGTPVFHGGVWWRVELEERRDGWVASARRLGVPVVWTHLCVSERDAWQAVMGRIAGAR